MKHKFITIICLGLLFFGHIGLLGALEIEITEGINTMTFSPDKTKAYTDPSYASEDKKFMGHPYGFGDLHVRGEVTNKIDFDFHLSRDNILQNTFSGKLKTASDYYGIEFGTFLGATDEFKKPEVGFLGSIQVSYPGIFFVSVAGSSSMGTGFYYISKNTRATYEAKVGFWLPNFIPSFSISSKRYTKRFEEDIPVVSKDELTKMQVNAEFFGKNSPIILVLNVGMETLTRSYSDLLNIETKDELNAAFFGLNLRWQVRRTLQLIAGFEIPYTFTATEPMEDPENFYKLYKFQVGMLFTVY